MRLTRLAAAALLSGRRRVRARRNPAAGEMIKDAGIKIE